MVDAAGDAAQRHVQRRAALIAVLMRHAAIVVAAAVGLVCTATGVLPPGRWLLAVLGGWSVYRLLTRSPRAVCTAVDYVGVLAACAAIPLLAPQPDFYTRNSVPAAIAGTAVVSFAVMLPPRRSLLMTVPVALIYAGGTAAVAGADELVAVPALYYFFLQWGNATLIRLMVYRAAAAVDLARARRMQAEVEQQVASARGDAEREQLALLHDTAASTLLMVTDNRDVARDRLAAQAARDLALLDGAPWMCAPQRMELVAALRDAATHLVTPVRLHGLGQLWIDGEIGTPVVAAAREAMTNVDRHARATTLDIEVGTDRVTLRDNGIGFSPAGSSGRHGLSESIVGRMRRAGGAATVTSAPGRGTTVELRWPPAPADAGPPVREDPERLVERLTVVFGFAMIVVALAVLVATVPYSLTHTAAPALQALLAVTAGVAPLAGVPGLLRGRWLAAWPAAVAVLVVAVAQPAALPPVELGGQGHWAIGALGWCLIPLLLGLPAARAAGALCAYWAVTCAVLLTRLPVEQALVFIGLGTASLFGVQMFALLFYGLVRAAADEVYAETVAYQSVLAERRITEALRTDYRDRYAKRVRTLLPVLTALSRGDPVDAAMRQRARAESRRLRELFDKGASAENPLTEALRAIVDAAEARGVEVELYVDGELPDLTDQEATALASPVRELLAGVLSAARIVVTWTPGELTVSAVCRGRPPGAGVPASEDAEVITADDTMWLLVRRPVAQRPASSGNVAWATRK